MSGAVGHGGMTAKKALREMKKREKREEKERRRLEHKRLEETTKISNAAEAPKEKEDVV